MKNLSNIKAMLGDTAWRAIFLPVSVLLALGTPALAKEADAGSASVVAAAPMTKLLHRVQETFPGRILRVELDEGEGTDEGLPVYEVKVLMSDGNVLKLFYDARTLRLERILGRYQLEYGSLNETTRGGDGRSGGGGAAGDDGPGHDDGDDHDGGDHESDHGSDDD